MWQGIDRRRFPRADFPCKVIVHKKQGVEKYSTHTENISSGGLCADIEKDLGLFSCVDIELMLDSSNVIKNPAKIVWIVKKSSAGKAPYHYDTGFEFVDLSQENHKKIDKAVRKLSEKQK